MKSITQFPGSRFFAVTGLAVMFAFSGSAGAYEIWVANQDEFAGTQVLDEDLNIIATITGSNEHTHMGDFTSDFSTYYSANLGESTYEACAGGGSSSVDAIDADTKAITASVCTAGRSHAVVVSEDDRFAYVNNLNDNKAIALEAQSQ